MDGNKYVLKKIEELGCAQDLDIFQSPTQIYDGGFMICIEGSCKVMVNAKTYQVERWGLIVVSPYAVIQQLDRSEDFDCVIIGISMDFLSSINISNKGDYFLDINKHPSISLKESEAIDILYFKEVLLREEQNETQPFYNEIFRSIMTIIVYKIFAIYTDREPNSELFQSRSNEIFNNFIYELLKNNKKERKLEFYAQKLHITASHLSRCVKKVSGKNASEMLIESVIATIKFRLLESKKSLTEISEEFNFCSNSSFSQYFKKYTSFSPKEFRAIR